MRTLSVMALLGCASVVFAGGPRLHVTARNPSDFARTRETITLPLDTVRASLDSPDPALITVSEHGKPLVSQITGDAVLFQSDFGPGETRRFVVSAARHRSLPAASPVSGMFVRPREDYAWENDLIAFRVYGPALAAEVNNGVDVWTKRVRYPIVAKWYKDSEGSAPGKDTYHTDRGEGADYFSVGRSLGAGGSGLWVNGAVMQPGVFTEQRTLASGPIRVSFELTYRWTLGGSTMTERRKVSLDAGQHLNRVEVRFDDQPPAGLPPVACGLVKRPRTNRSCSAGEGWCGLWGLTASDSTQGYLGTGIVLGPDTPATCEEDSVQYLLLTHTPSGSPFVYYAGAGWSLNGVRSEKEWNTILRTASSSLRHPLRVTIKAVR
jgi:pectinesterase